jgi:toxin-antitoxin system PIN domain toxin
MAGVIDTNILLYAANKDAAEHARAKSFLERAASGVEGWYLTEGIAYEFLRVATHANVFHQPLGWSDALSFLEALAKTGNFCWLEAREHHWTVLRQVTAELTQPSGNLFFDIRTVVLMKQHGIREIYSTDTDFLQFSGIVVVNPLKG